MPARPVLSRPTKAILPAAGHGTRMRPVSRVLPKELLPVGSTPAIELVLREAAAAGIEEIAVVVSPAKRLLVDYLESGDLEAELEIRLRFILQEEQVGLADAIWRCREFISGEPFGLLLPDNVVLNGGDGLRKMLELHAGDGREVLGALRLEAGSSGQFGRSGLIDFEEIRPNVLEIRGLADKRPGRLEIASGTTVTRTCGRSVCTPDVIAGIARLRGSTDGELDEVPVFQELIRQRGAVGCLLEGPLFDLGHPRGFAAANAAWLELGAS